MNPELSPEMMHNSTNNKTHFLEITADLSGNICWCSNFMSAVPFDIKARDDCRVKLIAQDEMVGSRNI